MLDCPEDVRIAMVLREHSVFLAHGDTVLKLGDRLILVLHHWERDYVTELFNTEKLGA